MLRSVISALIIACAAAVSATAQDNSNTILVMDGSGSMWGQIEGVNKIVIAREVVGDLLDNLPEDQNLGLTVYGHRERGNCADIETIVAPGPGTSGLIRDAVNDINPRGRTPMTDAIIAAAEALRYTEERATVILISDGIETCNPNPCAAARALEEAGIDFTAHVVGFDVSDPAALAQMQCLAGETGGQFLTAASASELTNALTTVVAEPVFVPQTVQIVGVLTAGGAELNEPIRWNILPEAGANLDGEGPGFGIDLPGGAYDVVGTRTSDGAEAGLAFEVSALETDEGQRLEVIFPEPQPDPAEITFRAVIGTEIGPAIDTPVFWAISSGADGTILDDEMANPLSTMLEQGSHTVTAYWAEQETSSQPRQFMVTADPREIVVVFEAPAITASLGAPATAVVGSMIEVTWNGPAATDDYIGIGKVEATGSSRWRNFASVSDGSPLQLLVPPEPGQYAISYFDGETRTVLGTVAIEVMPADIAISAPDTVSVSETFEVVWTGPDYRGDFIGIGQVGATGSGQWANFTLTEAGTPLRLQAPSVPGEYRIKYFLDQENWAATEVSITVTEPEISVTAPAQAEVSQQIEVAWTGPNTPGDFIGIGLVGATGSGQWRNFTLTSDGNPLQLLVPAQPGDYVIKYFLDQDNTPLYEVPISATPAAVTMDVPAVMTGGTIVDIPWTGPDHAGDFIGIGLTGATGSGQWRSYVETSTGSPAKLRVPTAGGDYLVKYFLEQRNTPALTVPVSVMTPRATLDTSAVAQAGSALEVAWTGPNYEGDYVGIGKVGASGSGRWESYGETADGSVLTIVLPEDPGEYVIRYFVNADRVAIAERALTIE